MKKILFPTDFSPASKNAFKYAIALAKEIGAKIEVIHVYLVPFTGTDLYLDLSRQRELRIEKQMQKEQQLARFCESYDFDNYGDKLVFPGLFIDQDIIDRSKKGCDIVIMGTKGERNALDKLMGSVTTRLMMNAGCPVLAIPENAEYKGIQEITYATTFSSKDQHFLAKLANFGSAFNARIHFLHVSDDPKHGVEDEVYIEGLPSRSIKFSVVSNASIMDGVDGFLQTHASDVLALYIPKRNLWERLFHSSFSKKMTFHTDTPLFVFHE